jgi:sortase A
MKSVTRRRFAAVFAIRFFGYFVLLTSLTGIIFTFLPVIKVGVTYYFDKFRGKEFVVENIEAKKEIREKKEEIKSKLPPIIVAPIDRQFGIVIPKINANSKVIANVDASNEIAYNEALKEGVAHAAGSAYPGEVGNTFLFAHSAGNFWEISRYNAIFFLLKELQTGDDVYIFFQGRRFHYVVTSSIVVDADQVQFLNTQTNFAQLTLQTCWPPGTALKRLLVIGKMT